MANRWRKHKKLADEITEKFTLEQITDHIDKTIQKVQSIKLEQAKIMELYEEKAVLLADKQKLLEALVHAQHLKATATQQDTSNNDQNERSQ